MYELHEIPSLMMKGLKQTKQQPQKRCWENAKENVHSKDHGLDEMTILIEMEHVLFPALLKIIWLPSNEWNFKDMKEMVSCW
jgi:hypothetical protein